MSSLQTRAAPQGTRRSFAIQLRVVHALLLREVITRYGRHNIGFLWLFVEPMVFTMGITLIWRALRAFHGSDIPIVAFAVTGYSTILMWRNMPSRCVHAMEPNQSLMYHRQVKPIDIYLSRMILEIAGATASFMALSVLFIGMEWMKPPEDILKVLLGWVMVAWLACGISLFVGALSERSDLVERFWHPMTYFMLPVSGLAVLVDALPPKMQDFILLLPMAHCTELIRDGYFGSMFRAHYDVFYLATWCLGLTILGLAETRGIGRRMTPG